MPAIRIHAATPLDDGKKLKVPGVIITGEPLGVGTFSTIYRCRRIVGNEELALKVVNKRYFGKTELKVMKAIKDCEDQHCANHHKFFIWGQNRCLLMPIYGPTLLNLLMYTNYTGMDIESIRTVTLGLFKALTFIHSLDIIHTDIKPENIMLRGPTDLHPILADFGGAVYDSNDNCSLVSTPEYRAPEVEIGSVVGYGQKMSILWDSKIDVWSAGCLVYELWHGTPLFIADDPNMSLLHQMRDLIGRLPYPIPEKKTRVHLTQILRETPCDTVEEKTMLNFICACLTLRVDKRPTAADMLEHEFVKYCTV